MTERILPIINKTISSLISINVKLSPKMKADLDEISKRFGKSRPEIFRIALAEYLESVKYE